MYLILLQHPTIGYLHRLQMFCVSDEEAQEYAEKIAAITGTVVFGKPRKES